MIRIQCAAENGFRRGGIHHPNGSSCYPEDFFSADNLALIKAEPKLMVQTGLEPDSPGTASLDELKKALAQINVEFNETDPRELLVARMTTVLDQAKAEEEKTKPKKPKGEKAE